MPTNRFVIDASVWIEYLQDTDKGKELAPKLENEDIECYTPVTVVAEIVSKVSRLKLSLSMALAAINNLSIIYEIDNDAAVLAGQLHAETKKTNKDFGMLDAFVAATARKLNAKILTTDSDFKSFKEAVLT